MKNLFAIALFATTFIYVMSCTKDAQPEEQKAKEVQQEKIEQIIPPQYLDTLRKLGLNINEGTNPPNIEGIFNASSLYLLTSNIVGDYEGKLFSGTLIKLYNYKPSTFSIDLLAKNLVGLNDTSSMTIVSGSGNKFSVYGKIKSNIGEAYAYFGILISAELVDGNLHNLRYGMVNIDNTHGEGTFIKQGLARIVKDHDHVSERVEEF